MSQAMPAPRSATGTGRPRTVPARLRPNAPAPLSLAYATARSAISPGASLRRSASMVAPRRARVPERSRSILSTSDPAALRSYRFTSVASPIGRWFLDGRLARRGGHEPDVRAPAPRACRLRALDVGLRLAQLGQQRVGLLLLGQGRVEQPLDLVQPDQLRPAAQRAVARDLVVLDRLRRRDQARVQRRAAGELLHHLLAFLEDALDRFARHALGLLAQEPEDLLEAPDLLLGLAAVRVERGLELLMLCHAGQLRQGLQYLVLGEVDALHGMEEQALQVPLGHCHSPGSIGSGGYGRERKLSGHAGSSPRVLTSPVAEGS